MKYIILKFAETVDIPKVEVTPQTIPTILNIVYAITGLLAVLFIAIGGFKYVTSGGDPQGTAKAKNTIIYACVGLVVVLSAFIITSFALGRL